MKEEHIILFVTLIGIIAFGMGLYIGENASKDRLYQEGFTNGSIATAAQINNEILNGLLTYGEFRTRVFYGNQTIPIQCVVYKGAEK